MHMSLARMPDLGSKEGVKLVVKLPATRASKGEPVDPLGEGLRDFYRRGDFTDVVLLCADQAFRAHRAVLAAKSQVFRAGFLPGQGAGSTGREGAGEKALEEVRIAEVANPEAVKIMLDYLYEVDDPDPAGSGNPEINKDVLRLAQNFQMPGLAERAARWLTRDLTTGNVVERLAICEEFGLSDLHEKILEQLTFNKRALSDVSNSPKIMAYPNMMRAMLQLAAGSPEGKPDKPKAKRQAPEEPQPKKRGRKCN